MRSSLMSQFYEEEKDVLLEKYKKDPEVKSFSQDHLIFYESMLSKGEILEALNKGTKYNDVEKKLSQLSSTISDQDKERLYSMASQHAEEEGFFRGQTIDIYDFPKEEKEYRVKFLIGNMKIDNIQFKEYGGEEVVRDLLNDDIILSRIQQGAEFDKFSVFSDLQDLARKKGTYNDEFDNLLSNKGLDKLFESIKKTEESRPKDNDHKLKIKSQSIEFEETIESRSDKLVSEIMHKLPTNSFPGVSKEQLERDFEVILCNQVVLDHIDKGSEINDTILKALKNGIIVVTNPESIIPDEQLKRMYNVALEVKNKAQVERKEMYLGRHELTSINQVQTPLKIEEPIIDEDHKNAIKAILDNIFKSKEGEKKSFCEKYYKREDLEKILSSKEVIDSIVSGLGEKELKEKIFNAGIAKLSHKPDIGEDIVDIRNELYNVIEKYREGLDKTAPEKAKDIRAALMGKNTATIEETMKAASERKRKEEEKKRNAGPEDGITPFTGILQKDKVNPAELGNYAEILVNAMDNNGFKFKKIKDQKFVKSAIVKINQGESEIQETPTKDQVKAMLSDETVLDAILKGKDFDKAKAAMEEKSNFNLNILENIYKEAQEAEKKVPMKELVKISSILKSSSQTLGTSEIRNLLPKAKQRTMQK